MAIKRLRGHGKHGAQETHQVGQADKLRQGLPRLIRREQRPAQHRQIRELAIRERIHALDSDVQYCAALDSYIDRQAGAVFA